MTRLLQVGGLESLRCVGLQVEELAGEQVGRHVRQVATPRVDVTGTQEPAQALLLLPQVAAVYGQVTGVDRCGRHLAPRLQRDLIRPQVVSLGRLVVAGSLLQDPALVLYQRLQLRHSTGLVQQRLGGRPVPARHRRHAALQRPPSTRLAYRGQRPRRPHPALHPGQQLRPQLRAGISLQELQMRGEVTRLDVAQLAEALAYLAAGGEPADRLDTLAQVAAVAGQVGRVGRAVQPPRPPAAAGCRTTAGGAAWPHPGCPPRSPAAPDCSPDGIGPRWPPRPPAAPGSPAPGSAAPDLARSRPPHAPCRPPQPARSPCSPALPPSDPPSPPTAAAAHTSNCNHRSVIVEMCSPRWRDAGL